MRKGKKDGRLHGFKVGDNSRQKARRIDKSGMVRVERFKVTQGKRKETIKKKTIKSVTGRSVPQFLKTKGVDKKLQVFSQKKFSTVFTD